MSLEFKIKKGNDVFTIDEKKTIDDYFKSKNKKNEYNAGYSDFVFNITFWGKDDNGIEYICGWHLDYEPRAKYTFLENPKVYHPLFHLHYGGIKMRSVYRELNSHIDLVNDSNFSISLIDEVKSLINDPQKKNKIDEMFLDHCIKSECVLSNSAIVNKTSFVPLFMIAPRIPFPPIDEYLGLDFIVSNFFEKSNYINFRKNSFFKQKIKESQNKLWKDYYDTIMGYWNNNNSCLKPNMLIPSLI